MITVRADYLSEQHLAEVALAIQNRWNIATFVKIHEIVVMDDEPEGLDFSNVVTAPLDSRTFEKGMQVIVENLELDQAFKLEREGKNRFRLRMVDSSKMPKWILMLGTTKTLRQTPEGVYECPHCGRWFKTELELSMHTKLHYII